MKVGGLYRYPIKGVGAEPLDAAFLSADAPFPGDRAWAIAHAKAPDRSGWMPKAAFLQVMAGPGLAAVRAETAGDRITLSHPDRPTRSFSLPDDAAQLLDWVRPIWPEDKPAPARVLPAPPESFADNGQATVHVLTQATLDALSEAAGQTVEALRFRANIVISDAEAWSELGWVGRRLRLGDAEIEVLEPTGRCRATDANPDTGTRDIAMLELLSKTTGGKDVGVYARVTRGGTVNRGETVELLA
ncbi:hypothetical protein SAMN04488020_107191 [Palleronia marisminoris]|uniref:MOSC domain protein n=1 Tax=Palleronia marisminoris TaxID=315423 RepID=A0A1Y5TA02_9RHOB|nr:MOSC domain-containing protein [Palleronia marisminoris]SFH16782.1 hypothetical protein SAMN04488020_107191 [Palleronia marisminoris]SLN55673.1 MOSC domain protein [Palleronia marisminoris]